MGVAPLQGLADLGSWRSGGMGGDPPARVQGGRQRWASCRGRWKRRDKAARVRVGRTTGPRAARFSPEDRNGGNACIGYPAFNGEVLTTSGAPAAGDAIPVGRGWCPPTTAAPATTAAGGVMVAIKSSGLGRILVDGSGRTLYLFEKDKGTTSSCYGACAGGWPPY